MSKTSITDLPRLGNADDIFGIDPFEKGLEEFIQNADTPVTIALQGEWGSGKTSLMNVLKENLCDSTLATFHAIWINAWEYALMKDARTTLIQIISKLVDEIAHLNGSKEVTSKLLGVAKRFAVSASKFAVNKVIEGADKVIDGIICDNEESTIGQLRTELQTVINETVAKKNRRFIFFIDDLDRIDPPIAVELLELLKNIFTLENCVFILAIDYDVIIKGLKPKFGELTDKNEREFRSFFDKIIQVPFSMPVNHYSIDNFLKDELKNIDYLNISNVGNKTLIENLAGATRYTVGQNPRSLKRLLNTLSLITCINKVKKNDDLKLETDLELFLNYALVAIQISYPKIYQIISENPDFTKWDNEIAQKENLANIEQNIEEQLNTSDIFDDDWEKILYRICNKDFFLKQNAYKISLLLNKMKSEIELQAETTNVMPNILEENISKIIRLSAITHISANDRPPINYDQNEFIQQFKNNLLVHLKSIFGEVTEEQKKDKSRAVLLINGKKIWLESHSTNGKICLKVSYETLICDSFNGRIPQYFESIGKTAEFDTIKNDFEVKTVRFSNHKNENYDRKFDFGSWKNYQFNFLRFQVMLTSISDFMQPAMLSEIASMIKIANETSDKLKEINK